MDDLRLAVGSKRQKVFVSRYEHVGLSRRGQCQQKVIVRISTNCDIDLRHDHGGPSQEIRNLRGIRGIEQALFGWARNDIEKLVDQLRGGDQDDAFGFDGGANLAPPPFDQGADQDGGVEDRADSGFSRRTAWTDSSICSSLSGGRFRRRAVMRSQTAAHRFAQVSRSMASATLICCSTDKAWNCWSKLSTLTDIALTPLKVFTLS